MKADVDAKTKVEADSANKGKELNVVCYSCGDIEQYNIGCNRPRIFFICHQTNHVVDKCPEWKRSQSAAQYNGSANKGLGFYHIDVEARGDKFSHWTGMDNFGVFTIEEGDIDETGILGNLRVLFNKD